MATDYVLEEYITGDHIFNLRSFFIVPVSILLTLHPPLHSMPPKQHPQIAEWKTVWVDFQKKSARYVPSSSSKTEPRVRYFTDPVWPKLVVVQFVFGVRGSSLSAYVTNTKPPRLKLLMFRRKPLDIVEVQVISLSRLFKFQNNMSPCNTILIQLFAPGHQQVLPVTNFFPIQNTAR